MVGEQPEAQASPPLAERVLAEKQVKGEVHSELACSPQGQGRPQQPEMAEHAEYSDAAQGAQPPQVSWRGGGRQFRF